MREESFEGIPLSAEFKHINRVRRDCHIPAEGIGGDEQGCRLGHQTRVFFRPVDVTDSQVRLIINYKAILGKDDVRVFIVE
jgi:hypothetical protein